MAGSLGLSGPTPLVYRGPMSDAADFLSFEDIRIAVNDELSKAAEACRDLLRANRCAVEAVAKVLFDRSRVDGREVSELLASQNSSNEGLRVAFQQCRQPPTAACSRLRNA